MSFLTFLGGEAVVGEGTREFLHVFRRGSHSWRVCVGFGEGSRRVGEGNWDFVILFLLCCLCPFDLRPSFKSGTH